MLRPRGANYDTLFLSVAIALALVVGLATAVVLPAALVIVFGILGTGIILLLPLSVLLLAELFLGAVIAGSAEYFAGISQAHWVPFLMGVALGLRAIMDSSHWQMPDGSGRLSKVSGVPAPFIYPAVVYLLTIVAATLIQKPPLVQLFVGMKNYLFMAGIFFSYAAMRNFEIASKWTWRGIVIVSCIQLPVVLYQRIFVASKLSNAGGRSGLSWDAVSGTFGGGLLGGHSGAMALFAAVVVGYCAVLWLNRHMRLRKAFLLSIVVLLPVFLAEVKAIVVWLLLAGSIAFARQIRSRPMAFVGGLVVVFLFAIAIVFSYKAMYYDGARSVDMTELYEKQVKYFFDTNKFNVETREMGRFASIAFWWDEQHKGDVSATLLGNGLGASRGSSSLAVGEVAKRYTFYIDTSAATALLWDLGIVGFASFVLTLVLAAWEAKRLGSDKVLSDDNRMAADLALVGIVLILSSVIYNRDVIDTTSVQFLLFFLLATVYRLNKMARSTSARPRLGK